MYLLTPNGNGYGSGYGNGNGYGDGNGYGNGYGDGNGSGNGYGSGNGSGSGNGDGNGDVGSEERFSFEQHIIMGAVRAHNLGEHDHEANS